MAGKNKLKKFSDILLMDNVFENFDFEHPELVHQPGKIVDFNGRWCKDHFHNDNPLVLELACGRGEYSVGLAEIDATKNYIGVDIKGARIWQGATIAKEKGLDHVAFMRTRIELIETFVGENEVDEIWITFPDPFLKDRKENRRLTSPIFLPMYQRLLKPGGYLHLKTDNPRLYYYTLDTLSKFDYGSIVFHHNDIYNMEYIQPELSKIQTYYERKHIADKVPIKYIKYCMA